jgi:hypothetical protein
MSVLANNLYKPCPFCGGAVEIGQPWISNGNVQHCGTIYCRPCGYSIGFHAPFLEEVWDKRAGVEPALSLLEECRDQFSSGTVLFGAKYDDLMGRINAVLDEK